MRTSRSVHPWTSTLLPLPLLAVALSTVYGWGGTWRVPEDCPTPQAAVAAAAEGDVILVAPGTYRGLLVIKKRIQLVADRGGVLTPDDPSDDAILDGGGTGQVVRIEHAAGVVIRGFTIRKGATYTGVNVYCWYSEFILEDNLIEDGCTNHSGSGGYGGGVAVLNSTGYILNNIIRNNDAWGGGGAIAYGGSEGIIQGNLIYGNSGDWGGGIDCSGGSPDILNNIIYNNHTTCWSGGGIQLTHSTSVVQNCTIVFNRASAYGNGFGGGIIVSGSTCRPTLINNIIAFNQSSRAGAGVHCANDASIVRFEYNNIYSNTVPVNVESNWVSCVPGETGLSVDPGFVNAGEDDFQLADGSPMIDAGDPDPACNDLDGTRNDLGAFGGAGFSLIDGLTIVQTILSIRVEGGAVILSWEGQPSYTYQVQRSDDLQTWIDVGPSSTGVGSLEVMDPGAVGVLDFLVYRLKITR